MIKKIHAFFSGKVQGVNFRYFTREKARQLGLKGWVRNLADGMVEMLVEGEEKKIKELIDFCQKRIGEGKVEKVELKEEQEGKKLDFFEIRHN